MGGQPGDPCEQVCAKSGLDLRSQKKSIEGIEIIPKIEELKVPSASTRSFLEASLWKRSPTWDVMTNS